MGAPSDGTIRGFLKTPGGIILSVLVVLFTGLFTMTGLIIAATTSNPEEEQQLKKEAAIEIKEVKETEEIPFEVKKEDDPNLVKDVTKVKQECQV